MNVTENIPTLFSLQYLMILFRNDSLEINVLAFLNCITNNNMEDLAC